MYYNQQEDKLHPKHKYVIAQMALSGIPTHAIEYYRINRWLFEQGSNCVDLGGNYGMSRSQSNRNLNVLLDAGFVYKRDDGFYVISKQCIKDEHLKIGLVHLGYV